MIFGNFSLGRFFKNMVTENLGLKLTAVILALFLVFLVRSQEETERLIDVEVTPLLSESPGGLVLTSELPETVKVRVRGTLAALDSMKREAKPVKMDLREYGAGTSTFDFYQEFYSMSMPMGVKFVRVTPETVQVRFERTVTKRVPLRVRTFGKLAVGTRFAGDPVSQPEEVTVMGPASLIRSLEYLETDEIDIEGLAVGDRDFEVAVRHADGVQLRGVDAVKVTLSVQWVPGQRMISGLLVRVEGTELSPALQPDEVAVALKGPQVALDRLDPSILEPVVDFSDEAELDSGVYRRPVSVRGLPELITISSIVPQKVRVRLSAPPQSGIPADK